MYLWVDIKAKHWPGFIVSECVWLRHFSFLSNDYEMIILLWCWQMGHGDWIQLSWFSNNSDFFNMKELFGLLGVGSLILSDHSICLGYMLQVLTLLLTIITFQHIVLILKNALWTKRTSLYLSTGMWRIIFCSFLSACTLIYIVSSISHWFEWTITTCKKYFYTSELPWGAYTWTSLDSVDLSTDSALA